MELVSEVGMGQGRFGANQSRAKSVAQPRQHRDAKSYMM
jgi:hypothetical protein